MRKGIVYALIFVLLLVGPSAVRYLSFYQLGSSERQEPPAYTTADVPAVAVPVSNDFVDEPEKDSGFILLDQAHDNFFTLEEIGYLDGRLAARGHQLRPFHSGDLAAALRSVKAFIVISPQVQFTSDEIRAVRDFVNRGGRLLLVGDPTRFSVFIEESLFTFTTRIVSDKIPLNSLANEFDIIFNADYLYNTRENEGNFRNIILQGSSLSESEFTDGLERLVFYGSHSLEIGPDGRSLLLGDENTWSSDTDRPGGLTLAASNADGRVVALGDLHFLTAPYHTVYDNSQFIVRIADFLTNTDERTYTLADFPYFFQDEVNLIYAGKPDFGPAAFYDIINLQTAFRRADLNLSLKSTADSSTDTLYLGLYNQADDLAELLASEGISFTIQPPILTEAQLKALAEEEDEAEEEEAASSDDEEETTSRQEVVRLIHSDLGNVQMSGTTLILFQENGRQQNIIVLAASQDGLQNSIERLLDLMPLNASYALEDCLRQGNLALCPSNIADEEVEAELKTGGAPPIPEDGGTSTGTGSSQPNPEIEEILNGINKGSIALDETVEGVLANGEAHLWQFSGGPATVNIVLEGGSDLDAVLELYGPDNEYINSADSTFTGGTEQILGEELGSGTYTIRVADFFNDGGSYALTISSTSGASADPSESEVASIFLFSDDDGTPLNGGFTSVARLAELLSQDYDVTVWQTSEDGPLEPEILDGYSLIIWDSGDYRNEAGFFDEDTIIILDKIDEGNSHLLVLGSSPTLFSSLELASISDVEVVGDDAVLLDGFSLGDVIELDQAYDAILFDEFASSLEDDDVVLFARGPGSSESGSLVGVGATNIDDNDTKVAFLMFPFSALPSAVQEQLLANLLNWIGI